MHGEWEELEGRIGRSGHYLDAVLGEIKRDAYLRLVEGWRGSAKGRLLKTDLFEEAYGPDSLMPHLATSFASIVGIDISLNTVVAAGAVRASPLAGSPPGHRLVADVRHLPFADRCFDLVLSPSTLDHFHEPADLGRSLTQILRTLGPRGRTVVTLDNRQNIGNPLLRVAKLLGRVPFYLGRSYRIGELAAEMKAAGFDVCGRTAIVHNPRLLATGSVWLARRTGSPRLLAWVHSRLRAMQRWETARFRYFTGSFVAALGVRGDIDDDQASL
ncbi:MAG: class I SAM-dependent methyltransferase [Acidobacteriota bacterium]|nr:class I SAM-dependent methyltransferase [Acidobacteriota bacterium]